MFEGHPWVKNPSRQETEPAEIADALFRTGSRGCQPGRWAILNGLAGGDPAYGAVVKI